MEDLGESECTRVVVNGDSQYVTREDVGAFAPGSGEGYGEGVPQADYLPETEWWEGIWFIWGHWPVV